MNNFFRASFGNHFRYFFFFFLATFFNSSAHAAVVLQYHHVSDKTPPSTSISPARFKEHMEYLEANKFSVIALPELVSALKKGTQLPDKTVAITFDDAYISVYDVAYPYLKKRGWPFTVFVNTDPIDKNKKLFTSWAQLQEMAKHNVTIANHSTAHNHLLRLLDGETRAEWKARVTAEVMDAEEQIKKQTGQSHRILAYPYGEYDEQIKALLKKLDFVAFGQQSGPVSSASDLLALPRFPFGGAYTDVADFKIKAASIPFAMKKIEIYTDLKLNKTLTDIVLPFGQKPVLMLALEDKKLLSRVNCFASGQGAIKTQIKNEVLLVQANKSLGAGRTRYNCTALSDKPGRYFWYSQQWLTKGKSGRWEHED